MNSKARQRVLTEKILKTEGFKTIEKYAQELNVSRRTIHSDLLNVSKDLLRSGYVLETKRGRGIRSVRLNKTSQVSHTTDFNFITKDRRRNEILKILIIDEKTVTYEGLSQRFMVSVSSIINDIVEIRVLLAKYSDLEIISNNRGTKISANSIDKQKAKIFYVSYITSQNLIYSKDIEVKKFLEQLFGKQIVTVCYDVLYKFIREKDQTIVDYYIFNVLVSLIVLTYSCSLNSHINGDELKMYSVKSCNFKIIDEISEELNITFTEDDRKYFNFILISSRFDEVSEQKKYFDFTRKLIEQVSIATNFSFEEDSILEKSLYNHVPAMLLRIENGIYVNNPFISDIKNEFPVLLNLLWTSIDHIDDYTDLVFSDEEVGFLVLHFQAAIERNKIDKKVLLLCPTGIASTQILQNRLEKVLPKSTTIDIVSLNNYDDEMINQYDFIISTVTLEQYDEKIIVVNPLIKDYEIESIFKVFNKSVSSFKKTKSNNIIHKFLSKGNIKLNAKYKNYNELLKTEGNILVDKGYIKKEYVDSLISRESYGGTDLTIGVAIPHGKPKFVLKTTISIIKLENTINWNESRVDVVFILCITEKDIKDVKNILFNLYDVFEDEAKLKKILNANTKKQIINVFKEE